MTTTADRRYADHMIADALTMEAVASELRAKSADLLGSYANAARYRYTAENLRQSASSKRQDAEQVPHHTETE